MGLKAIIRYPRIDVKRSEQEIHRVMTDAFLEAVKTWVITTTDGVPVLTGASKASFLKLAHEAGVSVSVTPVKGNRIAYGVETSLGQIIIRPGESYTFVWASDLPYIHIVEANNQFIAAANATLDGFSAVLPAPVIKQGRI